jgi:hypothetical protein
MSLTGNLDGAAAIPGSASSDTTRRIGMAGSLLDDARPILLKFSESARYLIVLLLLDARGQDTAQTCTTAAGLAYGRVLPPLAILEKSSKLPGVPDKLSAENSGICVASTALS